MGQWWCGVGVVVEIENVRSRDIRVRCVGERKKKRREVVGV
jgi:hypothetical protein